MNNFLMNTLSTLIGAITGGLITFLSVIYSLSKQRKIQDKAETDRRKSKQDMAMKIIAMELQHNITNLISIKNMIIQDSLNDTVHLEEFSELISDIYWKEYKTLLWDFEDKSAIEGVEYFYFNLLLEIKCKITDLERIEEHLKQGMKTLKMLEKYNEFHSEDNNTINK